MARLRIYRSISGATLLEVLVSLGLISLIFVLVMMVVGGMNEASQLEWIRVRTWTRTMLTEPSSFPAEQQIGPYRLEKRREAMGNGLELIEVSCFKENELLYSQKRWEEAGK